MRRLFALALTALLLPPLAAAQTATLTLDDGVIAPKSQLGIGINGGGSWFNFVGANLVDDPSFEGPEDEDGFAKAGWPWGPGGDLTAAVDGNEFVHGAQSQRVTVHTPPASMQQGRVDLPQLPHVMTARPDRTYRIKAQIKSDTPGARVRLGVVDGGWQGVYGQELTVGSEWTIVTDDYQPAAEHLLRGIAVQFLDAGTYWIDDLVAWDVTDIDPVTGLNGVYVARLKELAPASLRLGGLGVNGIPLESYLRDRWGLDYGPPDRAPDFDLNTFLVLCREVGAIPFITVPPAFSDGDHWQIGDLTYEVISDIYADHGNLVDYLGGDANTAYGARREADGFPRWDQQFDQIYLELGNELWGTPDDHWDMDPDGDEDQATQMNNFATYNQVRMTEMKARPGWRANMRLGFCGRGPEMWMGGWPGSYDGTLVPAIGSLTDFSTIDLYYGHGAVADGDDAIYGSLFATAVEHERTIAAMKQAFRDNNNGQDIETTVYEGNATWGGYEGDLHDPSPIYYKEVSLGAAVSLVDLYAAANRAGVTVNNHFHYGGNVWGATGGYPQVLRKPAFWALKLFNVHVAGDLVGCSVDGGGSWDDALTGEQAVPYVACYPYLAGEVYSLLVINRHRTEQRQIHLPHTLAPVEAIWLTGDDINLNNEASEQVTLTVEPLSGVLQDGVDLTVPAHTAVVFKLSKTGDVQPDGGMDAGDDGGDAGVDAGPDAGQDAGPDAGPDAGEDAGTDAGQDVDPGDDGPGPDDDSPGDRVEGSCGCAAGAPTHTLTTLCLLGLFLLRRRSRA